MKPKDPWKEPRFSADYVSFLQSLGRLAMLRCTKMCRGGGGNPWCKIRRCAERREFAGCWECGEVDACRKLPPSYRINLDRIRRRGLAELLAAA